TMAGAPWAEGAPNETAARANSELWLQGDLQHSLFSITYSIIFVLGLVGNGLALYLLAFRVEHLAHSYVYMINLALVDTLLLGVLPLRIHYHLNLNNWVFGDVACRVTGALFYLNIYLSIAFFTCICVDRCVAVLHPFTYIHLRATHCLLVATALWVVALGATIPLVLRGPLHNEGVRNTTACFENFPTSSWARHTGPYNVLVLVFGFAIPFVLILVVFPLVARSVSRIQRSVSKRKALSTIYTILAICVLCLLPFHLTHLLHFLRRIQLIQDEPFTGWICRLRGVTLALVSLKCCLNPILCYHSSSSKWWHCNLRLRFRSKKVFTICDRDFGEPSWDYKLRGSETHRGGIS
ncbi:LPAR6 protein, partial [Formicarius rufipectus]|nr:LPAR6 protein [Formicarius rufipectus]